MAAFDDLTERVARLRSDIEECRARSESSRDSVVIVAVSKQFPPQAVDAAVRAGIADIGENRVQETAAKKPEVTVGCMWHLIGHLQKNKVAKALELYDMIQSVDSVGLAEVISRKSLRPVDILLQVNSTGEETKYGLTPDSFIRAAGQISRLPNLRIKGVMTIGPLTDDERRIERSFRLTRSLYESLDREGFPNCDIEFLSMGMSGDYRMAIREGSNMVRIGTAIFGRRG
jgi:pyridoxal phosphate enzyme (YggS family)